MLSEGTQCYILSSTVVFVAGMRLSKELALHAASYARGLFEHSDRDMCSIGAWREEHILPLILQHPTTHTAGMENHVH